MKLRPVSAALVLGAAPLLAQTPQRPPTFEVGIEVINLNLSVTDGRNNYVTDLAEKDFAVFEDGIRQELSFYTHENLAISMAVMIDVSASMDEKLPQARAAALRLLKTLRAQDAAQVVQFNDRATVLQDFTADHTLLEAAVGKTAASGPTALHNALYIALKELSKDKKGGQLRLRLLEPQARRQVAAHRGPHPEPGGAPDPAQARVLRAGELAEGDERELRSRRRRPPGRGAGSTASRSRPAGPRSTGRRRS